MANIKNFFHATSLLSDWVYESQWSFGAQNYEYNNDDDDTDDNNINKDREDDNDIMLVIKGTRNKGNMLFRKNL